MSSNVESFIEIENLLMNKHLVFNSFFKLLELVVSRLVAIQQDKTNLCELAAINQVIDVVTPVVKLSVTLSVRYGRFAACRNRIARVVTKQVTLSVQRLDV